MLKAIPFQYLKLGDEFFPAWIVSDCYGTVYKKDTVVSASAVKYGQKWNRISLDPYDMVLVDESYDDSQYIADEIRKFNKRVFAKYESQQEFEFLHSSK